MALDQNIGNFKKVTVNTTYDDTAVSIVLSAGHGAELPDPASGEYNLVWWDSTVYTDPADDPNVEIVRVTAKSTDTLTVTRNQESSGASTKNTGASTYKMLLGFTKKSFDDLASTITDDDGDTTVVAGDDDTLTFNAGGSEVMTIADGTAVLKTNWTAASQTCADLGTVTTADINGGTIDGVTIGGSAAPTVTDLGSVATCDINGGTINTISNFSLTTGAAVVEIADEDDMVSNSAVKLCTQQSIKKYVDDTVAAESGLQLFTADGTFTVPAGVTKVYLTMCGAGGGGGGSSDAAAVRSGGGGGAGESIINYPLTVTPAAELTVTINAGGAGGLFNGTGGTGGTTVFDSITLQGGAGGGNTQAGEGTGGIGAAGNNGDGNPGSSSGTPNRIVLAGGDGGLGDGAIGGAGGSSRLGLGAIGGAYNTNGTAAAANSGSGGSGAGDSSSANYVGGAGGSGFVLVQWQS